MSELILKQFYSILQPHVFFVEIKNKLIFSPYTMVWW
jgi:hypothetical protein